MRFKLSVWLLLLLTVPAGARAQGFILPRQVPGLPRLPALSVKRQRIQVSLNAGTARTEVEQVFANPTDRVLEGTYLFPLPEDAAVSQFRMTIDQEPVEGKVLDRDEAGRIYEDYVRRIIDPGLLEYVGRGAFQARVFPIPAHGEKKIGLTYSQVLPFNAGIYEYRYPMNQNSTGGPPVETVITAAIHSPQPIKAVYSPSTNIAVSRQGDQDAKVSAESDSSGEAKDFLLYYTVSQKEFGLNMLAHRRGDEDGYFVMMMAPPRAVPREQVAAKDILFVFDTSGSMSGRKIEQAKQALRFALEHLNPRDRFNVIRFSSEVEPFRKALVPATPAALGAAKQFVDSFQAAGGTAIDDALATTFESIPKVRLASNEERPTMIVFMTDGEPTVGETNLERILANVSQENRHRARIFVFGVGDDVNTLLLDRLARDGDGAAEYVRPNEDLELKVSAFVSKIANPVLSDLKLDVSGVQVRDLNPQRVPDLFAGSQLLLFGRYKGSGPATVRLTGQFDGREQSYSYPVQFPESERENAFIPRLWASRKIGSLLEEIRLHGENPELKDEVVRLSKEFGIPTPYTSILVEDPRELQRQAGVNRPIDQLAEQMRGLGIYAIGGRTGAHDGVAQAPPPADQSTAGAFVAGRGAVGGGAGGYGGGYGGLPDSAGASRQAAPAAPGQYAFGGRDSASAGGFNQQTGANAVAASKAVNDLKRAEVEASGGGVRRVGDKTFLFRDGAWTDSAADGKGTTLAVKFGSEAYFQIVRRYPELAKYLALGQNVAVQVRPGLTLKVGAGGQERLTADELTSLKR